MTSEGCYDCCIQTPHRGATPCESFRSAMEWTLLLMMCRRGMTCFLCVEHSVHTTISTHYMDYRAEHQGVADLEHPNIYCAHRRARGRIGRSSSGICLLAQLEGLEVFPHQGAELPNSKVSELHTSAQVALLAVRGADIVHGPGWCAQAIGVQKNSKQTSTNQQL